MTTALATVGATLAAGIRTKPTPIPAPRRDDRSTAFVAASRDRKIARLALQNAREERLVALLTDPQVMGLAVTFGGLAAANLIPWSQNQTARGVMASTAAATAVLMGLGRAGVGDLTTLAMAGAAGFATATNVTEGATVESMPWYSLLGPPGQIYEVLRRLWD